MREYFKEQLETHKPMTQDSIDKIEYKRLWSGELVSVGDIILFAYLFKINEPDKIGLITLTDKKVDWLSNDYEFLGYHTDILPVLKHKKDSINRNIKDIK